MVFPIMSQDVIDKAIVSEIRDKLNNIRKRDLGWLTLLMRRRRSKAVRNDATRHSYRIEEPNNHNGANSDGLWNLEKAFRYAEANLDLTNLTPDMICSVAAIIEPRFSCGSKATYRALEARPQGSGMLFESPEKISNKMDEYANIITALLMDDSTKGSLEAAIYAHLHLVRIHPFTDGNGRTARTLQNVILEARGLPPPIIHAGERFDYYNHLERAIRAWTLRNATTEIRIPDKNYSSEEKEFFDYVAGKVSSSLDIMLGN